MPVKNENDRDIYAIKKDHEEELAKYSGVTGIYTGLKKVDGIESDTLSIVVMVREKKPLSELKIEEIIPTSIDGHPTDVVVCAGAERFSGQIAGKAKTRATLEDIPSVVRRPLVGGCGIAAEVDDEWGIGTLGCFVKDAGGATCLLSNFHVLGLAGNPVFQPDPFNPNYQIGVVKDSILNTQIDAGILELPTGTDFENYILQAGSIQGTYNLQTSDLPGYSVKKSGARTGFTFGSVTSIDFSVVNDGGITMVNQILIHTSARQADFSDHGDSGSVIINDQFQIVGLLWGGKTSSGVTFACPIAAVLSQLNISIITDNYPPLYAVHQGANNSGVCKISELITSWSQDTLINSFNPLGVDHHPNLCMYKDRIYNIRQGRNSNEAWCSRFDGAAWYPDLKLAPTEDPENAYGTSYAPALASYYGDLYGVHQGTQTNGQVWWFKHDSHNWSADTQTNYSTAYGPALVVYKGLMYCFRTDPDQSIHYNTYQWSASGGTWGPDVKATPTSNPSSEYVCNDSPSAVVFDGKIYCFHSGNSTDSTISCFTFDGTTWSDDMPLSPTGGSNFASWLGPKAVVWNNALYCFYVSTNYLDVHYFYLQNGTWSQDDPTGFQSTEAPALCSIPTYKHINFEITTDGNENYATVEGVIYGLDLSNPTGWIANYPTIMPASVTIKKVYYQGGPGSALLALDQYGRLLACPVETTNPSWSDGYPSIPPVPFFRIAAVTGGPMGTTGYIFALDANGILYCADTPNGGWIKNFPSQQPEPFAELCSVPQGPGVPGILYALDKTGSIWSVPVPGGTWSSTATPAISTPMRYISVVEWFKGMVNGEPVTGINIYGLDFDNNFWGIQLGVNNWTQDYPAPPPAQLAIIYPTTISARTLAADLNGNYYLLRADTGAWQTNSPIPLPPPETQLIIRPGFKDTFK
jgi:hypothetical protein